MTSTPVLNTKTITVHRSPTAAGVVLEVTYRHPDDGGVGHVDAEREAAEVLGVLLDLPTETRRELQRLMVEFSDTFAAAPGPKAKVHSPVRGGPRGGR